MHSIEDIVAALLAGTPVKPNARLKKTSKNTVKKYRSILDTILTTQPSLGNDLKAIYGRIPFDQKTAAVFAKPRLAREQ